MRLCNYIYIYISILLLRLQFCFCSLEIVSYVYTLNFLVAPVGLCTTSLLSDFAGVLALLGR